MRCHRAGRRLWLIAAAVLLVGCSSPVREDRATSGTPTRVVLEGPTTTPIQTINNLTLVYTTINEIQGALMVVDTGAQRTLVTPALLRRMKLPVSADAPRRTLYGVGGHAIEVSLVRIASVRTGAAVVENLEVGVVDFLPRAPFIDGLLGGDYLGRFRTTLDSQARVLRLEPLVQ
ncbi:MAG TPA: retropepsin-like aspartic protease [Methylomirabilota bacterium]|nr:retropepsin-like aspartic protease [Methylomirabilota bacterium]